MEHTFDELKKKTIAQLREIAGEIDHEAVQGVTQMHKDEVIAAICTALGLEMHEHHEVVGVDKIRIKAEIRALKKERDAAMGGHDAAKLKETRRKIKKLKHRLRRATV